MKKIYLTCALICWLTCSFAQFGVNLFGSMNYFPTSEGKLLEDLEIKSQVANGGGLGLSYKIGNSKGFRAQVNLNYHYKRIILARPITVSSPSTILQYSLVTKELVYNDLQFSFYGQYTVKKFQPFLGFSLIRGWQGSQSTRYAVVNSPTTTTNIVNPFLFFPHEAYLNPTIDFGCSYPMIFSFLEGIGIEPFILVQLSPRKQFSNQITYQIDIGLEDTFQGYSHSLLFGVKTNFIKKK
jgi:hypothetical protein